jgi:hypothetical protein
MQRSVTSEEMNRQQNAAPRMWAAQISVEFVDMGTYELSFPALSVNHWQLTFFFFVLLYYLEKI